MASIKLDFDNTTEWGDMAAFKQDQTAPAAAGASTPPPKNEKGWTDVPGAPRKGKKANAASEPVKDSVSKTLVFTGNYDPRGNRFGIFAEDDDE